MHSERYNIEDMINCTVGSKLERTSEQLIIIKDEESSKQS